MPVILVMGCTGASSSMSIRALVCHNCATLIFPRSAVCTMQPRPSEQIKSSYSVLRIRPLSLQGSQNCVTTTPLHDVMSAQKEVSQIITRYDQASPQSDRHIAPQQQSIERDLTLLIRAVIRDNFDREVIDSFQAVSLSSANDKDVLFVETILEVLRAEVRATPEIEAQALENLIPYEMRKHQHGLEDFICQQLQCMRKIRPRDQRQHAIPDTSTKDPESSETIADPDEILRHLLDQAAKLQRASGELPYEAFCRQHEHNEVLKWLKQGVGNDRWRQLFQMGKIIESRFLEHLAAEPLSSHGPPANPGWYILMLTDENDVEFWALYVGQADNIRHRKGDHFKFVFLNTEGSLLYFVWRGNGPVPKNRELPRIAKFIVLGMDVSGLQDREAELFRNIGEMFFALMTQTLQHNSLVQWLPEVTKIQSHHIPLNVALPLHQNSPKDAARTFSQLGRSENPAAIAYHKYRSRRAFDAANKSQRDVEYAFTRKSNRNRGKFFLQLFRNPDPKRSEPLEVRVRCSHCGWETADNMPYFHIATDSYVMRTFKCAKCPVGVKKGGKSRAKQRLFVPIDANWKVKSIARSKIDNDRNRDYRRDWKIQKKKKKKGSKCEGSVKKVSGDHECMSLNYLKYHASQGEHAPSSRYFRSC